MLLIDRNNGRVAPQPFELVELAERRMKNVDDHIHIIEEHPASLLDSLDVMRALAFLA